MLDIIGRLYACFIGADAMLCEINPLMVTPGGEVKALDSKFTVDDSALFRHPDIAEMRDLRLSRGGAEGAGEGRDLREAGRRGRRARQRGRPDDVERRHGHVRGRPPGELLRPRRRRQRAGRDRRARGDHRRPQVRSIMFNIFGGIARCDEVARGILQALEQLTIDQPIVVRLDGTNAEEGDGSSRRRGREPPSRGDDDGRRQACRGARGMTDVVGAGGGVSRPRRPEGRRGPRAARVLGRGAHCARRGHRGRAHGSPPARSGLRGWSRSIPRPACAQTSSPRRSTSRSPTRPSTSSRAASRRTISPTSRPRSVRWPASPAGSCSSRTRSTRTRRSRKPSACATRRTSAPTPRRSGAGSSRPAHRGRGADPREATALDSWLDRVGSTGEEAARVRADRRPHRRRAVRRPQDLPEGQEVMASSSTTTRASPSRASRAARAASTGSATASTGRTSSRA